MKECPDITILNYLFGHDGDGDGPEVSKIACCFKFRVSVSDSAREGIGLVKIVHMKNSHLLCQLLCPTPHCHNAAKCLSNIHQNCGNTGNLGISFLPSGPEGISTCN